MFEDYPTSTTAEQRELERRVEALYEAFAALSDDAQVKELKLRRFVKLLLIEDLYFFP